MSLHFGPAYRPRTPTIVTELMLGDGTRRPPAAGRGRTEAVSELHHT